MLTKEDRAEIRALIAHVISQVYLADVQGRGATEMIDEQPNPESLLIQSQRKSQVLKILEALPGKDRDLLRLVFLEESDKDEICRTLRVDRELLRVLVQRAKSQFRAELERAIEFSPEALISPPQIPVIVRITARAIEVLGTREKALRWLETPVRSLGDRTPLSLLESPEGISRVEDTLGRIEHGVW